MTTQDQPSNWRETMIDYVRAQWSPGVTQVFITTRAPSGDTVSRAEYGASSVRVVVPPYAASLIARCWTLAAPNATVFVDGHAVTPEFLVADHHLLCEDASGARLYRREYGGEIIWMDKRGPYRFEVLSDVSLPTFAVVWPDRPEEALEPGIREQLQFMPSGLWPLPPGASDSASPDGRVAVHDCLWGYQSIVADAAAWVRRVLPRFSGGVPSKEDVQAKLSLEKRLREQEGVTGSLRPLALTLEAIQDDVFSWPGLWVVTGPRSDVRHDLPLLLAWDAVCHVVAGASRFHAKFKTGLCYENGVSSAAQVVRERRYSKRDDGVVDSVYLQVNPKFCLGASPDAVAGRLLQLATHELAHLMVSDLNSHDALFAERREVLLMATQDLLPEIARLVETLRLHHRGGKTPVMTPVLPDEWVRHALTGSVRTVEHLAQVWGSIRNLTGGRAMREVQEILEGAQKEGLCRILPDGRVESYLITP